MQAFERDEFVLLGNWSIQFVFHLELLALDLQELFCGTNLVCFPGGKSFEEGVGLQWQHQLIKWDFCETFFIKDFLIQLLNLFHFFIAHLLSFFSLSSSESSSLALSLGNSFKLQLLSFDFILFISMLIGLLVLFSLVKLVGAESETEENKEEA